MSINCCIVMFSVVGLIVNESFVIIMFLMEKMSVVYDLLYV